MTSRLRDDLRPQFFILDSETRLNSEQFYGFSFFNFCFVFEKNLPKNQYLLSNFNKKRGERLKQTYCIFPERELNFH